MTRMCNIILEWGPAAIICVEPEFPLIAYQFFGHFVRCEFAHSVLGQDWGTKKADESTFVDANSNRTAGAVEFILEGFPPSGNDFKGSTFSKESVGEYIASHSPDLQYFE